MLSKVFLCMAVLLLITVPIGAVIAIISVLPSFLDPSFAGNALFVLRQIISGLDSTPLLAIPMFVLSGILMAKGGISQRLFNVFAYFLGDRTAGMPCAVVITCLFYGAISGSAPATTAAVGAMTIPVLLNLGYDVTFVSALIAVSGGLGVIIPPSIPFILYAMASDGSVGDLFMAGILPGILIGSFLMGYSVFYCKKYGEDKEKIHANVQELREKGFGRVLAEGVPALLSPVMVLGGIYGGIVTPTEAAVVSVIYALIVCLFVYHSLRWNQLYGVIRESVKTVAPLLFILGAAAAFARVLTLLQAPQQFAAMMGSIFTTKISLLLAINVFLLIVGMLVDTGAAILILTPILLPLVSQFGISQVHFGVIMICNLAIGFVTPPVGVNLYVASAMTGVPVMSIAKKAVPFMVVFFIALMLITFVPGISLLLTSAM